MEMKSFFWMKINDHQMDDLYLSEDEALYQQIAHKIGTGSPLQNYVNYE